MRRCPTCNQTFAEEWLSFCTVDGTTLVDEAPPAEPPPTIMASSPPASPSSSDQATWNLPSAGESGRQLAEPQAVQPVWQPPPPPSYAQPNKSLATAAMVIGIISVTVGWMCFGPIPAIAAIIMGGVALSQIKKDPERVGGKQFAVVGVVTGGVTVIIYVGVVIFYLFLAIIAAANS